MSSGYSLSSKSFLFLQNAGILTHTKTKQKLTFELQQNVLFGRGSPATQGSASQGVFWRAPAPPYHHPTVSTGLQYLKRSASRYVLVRSQSYQQGLR